MTTHRNRRSRFKVAPGTYSYGLGTAHALDADANLSPANNIILWLFSGSWTHDLRNVTFLIPITPENANRRPADMIYVDEFDDLTVLGGTVWIDQDEPSSQARLTSLTPSTSGPQRATSTVEKGCYNVRARAAAGPRNQGRVDTSPPTHFTRSPCNFWKENGYDVAAPDTTRTFSTTVLTGSPLQADYVIYMQVGPNGITANRQREQRQFACTSSQGHDDQ